MMRRPDESNKMQHHTAFYSSDQLVVRRGQEFQVNITFNRPYDPARDKIAVEFVIGELSRFNTISVWGGSIIEFGIVLEKP